MGIASGDAVAGKIGTRDQVKVTAFGPVVNLASRLEGMTRLLNSCILADAETVKRIEAGIAGPSRPVTRCLGRFQPFGMESSLDVFQVLPSGTVDDESLEIFKRALECFQSGDLDFFRMATLELTTMTAMTIVPVGKTICIAMKRPTTFLRYSGPIEE